jgi:hypothetical protein
VYEPGIGYVSAIGRQHAGIEGAGTSTWLEHGVRVTPGTPTNGPEVLVLGDSFTEALMIDGAATFAAIATAELNRMDAPLRLVNVGRSRMSCVDYVSLVPRYEALVHPKWVVVEVRGDDFGADAWKQGRTRFVEDGKGTLSVQTDLETEWRGLQGFAFGLRQRSMVLGYGYNRLSKFRRVPEPPLFKAGATPSPIIESEREYPVEEELDLLDRAWRGRLTLLYLSEFLEPDPIEPRVRSFCAQRRLSCVFTREANEQLRSVGKAPTGFPNTAWSVGHLNADGHKVAGEVLARELHRVSPSIQGSR